VTDKEVIKDGSVEEFYESGQLDWRGNYKDGKGEGLFEYYYKNGQLEKRGNVKEGKPDGLFE
jgi:antitoxin component YwqK of YwqJK toxin-antitoxin module